MVSWPTDPHLVETVRRMLGSGGQGDVVDSILTTLNFYPKSQQALLEHLDSNPDALVSGRSDGPASRLKLIDLLAERYPQLVVRPQCSSCGRATLLNRWGSDGNRICGSCYVASRLVTCGLCGLTKPVGGRHSEHGIVCPACIQKDPKRRHECSKCGHILPVAARDETGAPLCQNCRPLKPFVCAGCGRTRTVKSLKVEAGNLCWACYKRHHKQTCAGCGREHTQVPRRGPNGERLCDRCWHPAKVPCRDCGKPTSAKKAKVSGSYLCHSCYTAIQPRRTCGACGNLSAVWAHLPLGPVCSACYQRIRTKPDICSLCQERRALVGTDGDGHLICAACCGQPHPWSCHACGALAAPHSKGRCPKCAALEELTRVISKDGAVVESLKPMLNYFDVEARPLSAIEWTRTRSAAILRRLVSIEDITHQALDVESSRQAAGFLRSLLVFTTVLPPRDALGDTTEWLGGKLSALDPGHQTILRRYAVWHVLARANRRPQRPATRHHARERLLTALRLTTWVEARGGRLGGLSQAALDLWLAEGPPARAEVRHFIRWARRHGLVGHLRAPLRHHGRPSQFVSPEDRWAALHRCVVDSELRLNLRVAGALLLLFGLGPTSVATTRVHQVIRRADYVELLVGRTPIRLPGQVATLVLRQWHAAEQARTGWLFPGKNPGRHLNPGALGAAIKDALGHGVLPSRNAALAHLANELPVPVLADYLGLAHSTAAQWAELVEHQWGEYVLLRREGLRTENRAGFE